MHSIWIRLGFDWIGIEWVIKKCDAFITCTRSTAIVYVIYINTFNNIICIGHAVSLRVVWEQLTLTIITNKNNSSNNSDNMKWAMKKNKKNNQMDGTQNQYDNWEIATELHLSNNSEKYIFFLENTRNLDVSWYAFRGQPLNRVSYLFYIFRQSLCGKSLLLLFLNLSSSTFFDYVGCGIANPAN